MEKNQTQKQSIRKKNPWGKAIRGEKLNPQNNQSIIKNPWEKVIHGEKSNPKTINP